jgi:hypothetical protein
MSEPLVCEDSDLQRLLDTVHSQPGAQILYQDTVRRGGLFGFFAREVHRIAYRVAEPGTPAASDDPQAIAAELIDAELLEPVSTGTGTAQLPALEDLLASVDAVESAGGPGQHRAPGAELQRPMPGLPAASQQEEHHDFAALLRSLSAGDPLTADPGGIDPGGIDLVGTDLIGGDLALSDPAAAHPLSAGAPGADVLSEDAPSAADPTGAHPVGSRQSAATAAPKSNVTAFGKPDARARLEMLMHLRQVGVPVSVNPRADTHSLYEALENILEELPAPATPPRGAGEVLAVVGESGPALQAAHTCAAMLRLPRTSIKVAGLPELAGAEPDYSRISGHAEALRLRTELSRADLPSIVVIATDVTEAGSDDRWAAEMLTALCPTAVWAVVDARWKTEDSRAELDRLGRVDALVVHSAQLSASPASVWDLDLPLGLLDGRAASTFAWTGLLFRLLRVGARHRASA